LVNPASLNENGDRNSPAAVNEGGFDG
jgi:hypothetical protein